MKNLLYPKFIIIFLLIVVASCQRSSRVIQGEVIEFDLTNIGTIQDSSWIKIDSTKLVHLESISLALEAEYSLPASRIRIDTLRAPVKINGRDLGRSIMFNLNKINQSIKDSTKAKYRVIKPYLIGIDGLLKIAKTDSSLIKVEIPKGYPIEIYSSSYN